MSAKRILITGVTGFIGSNLAERLLREGYEVVGLDSLAYGREEQVPKGVDLQKFDIRSKDIYPAFEGVHTVFHLAAKNDLIACQEDPVETIDINVRGTANVFEAARRGGAKKVIFASSSAIEEGEARLNGFYAISKISGERITAGYREGFGLNSVILRYFNVYGPRQDYRRIHPPVMSAFIIKILKGEQPVLFEGYDENKRDFIFVDDLNDFHLLCLKDDKVDNRLFRLGSGRSYSMKEILDAVEEVMGVKVNPIIMPRSSNDTPTSTLADIREAEDVGWIPKTSLLDGLKSQVEYIKGEFAKGRIK